MQFPCDITAFLLKTLSMKSLA